MIEWVMRSAPAKIKKPYFKLSFNNRKNEKRSELRIY